MHSQSADKVAWSKSVAQNIAIPQVARISFMMTYKTDNCLEPVILLQQSGATKQGMFDLLHFMKLDLARKNIIQFRSWLLKISCDENRLKGLFFYLWWYQKCIIDRSAALKVMISRNDFIMPLNYKLSVLSDIGGTQTVVWHQALSELQF